MDSSRFIPSILLAIVLLSLGLLVQVDYASASPEFQTKLEKAADYLLNMYNESIGLVANSEDKGLYKSTGVPCNSTYWVYSDNLWAGWALRPFNLTIAENITETAQRYVNVFGRSMLFEAAIGDIIPTTIQANRDVSALNKTVNGVRIQVLLDRHQYGDSPNLPFNDAEKYADLCFYLTINYWMMNDTRASEHWFRTGEDLWNKSTRIGFYDKAVYDTTDHLYSNFKLGLFLLAQRVTNLTSPIVREVEARLWDCANDLGGVVTHCYLNGSFYGTANAETTAAALLSYNDELVARLQRKKSLTEVELENAISEAKDLISRLATATNQIDDLEDRLKNTETEIQSLGWEIRNMVTIWLVSLGGLTAVALIIGIEFLNLRKTKLEITS